jgi:hypothetical protein
MTTELQYTSSIFQLAFGVNAVFALLLNHYFSLRAKLTDEFIRKLKTHNPALSLDGKQKHITKYLFRAIGGYRIFHAYFIFCIVVAIVSSGVSLCYLLQAALAPTAKISSTILAVLTIGFLIISPILYFVFLRASDWFFLLVTNRAIQKEDVSLVEKCMELSEMHDMASEMIAEAQILVWQSKKRRLIESLKVHTEFLIHPVRFIQRLRATHAAERARRRINEKG